MKNISALVSGLLFGMGLAFSGMTDTAKVLGFLNLAGNWDPTLLFVMAGALTVAIPGFYLVRKRSAPLCDTNFQLPTNTIVDKKLIGGSLLFGIGWGLYGYCPGPAIAALSYLQPATVIFIIAMGVGMWVEKKQGK